MATMWTFLQVKTWYGERGDSEPLVALHGGVVDARIFDTIDFIDAVVGFLTQEKPDLCNRLAVDFLASDPVPTVAPMRRMPTGSAA